MTREQLIEAFTYLDELRVSGAYNTWGASRYLEEGLGLGHRDTIDAHGKWMKTFKTGVPVEQRVSQVVS